MLLIIFIYLKKIITQKRYIYKIMTEQYFRIFKSILEYFQHEQFILIENGVD